MTQHTPPFVLCAPGLLWLPTAFGGRGTWSSRRLLGGVTRKRAQEGCWQKREAKRERDGVWPARHRPAVAGHLEPPPGLCGTCPGSVLSDPMGRACSLPVIRSRVGSKSPGSHKVCRTVWVRGGGGSKERVRWAPARSYCHRRCWWRFGPPDKQCWGQVSSQHHFFGVPWAPFEVWRWKRQ